MLKTVFSLTISTQSSLERSLRNDSLRKDTDTSTRDHANKLVRLVKVAPNKFGSLVVQFRCINLITESSLDLLVMDVLATGPSFEFN